MDPFLFALVLSMGVGVGWGAAWWMGKSQTERPLHLVMGGMGALLGAALARMTIEGGTGAIEVLAAGLAGTALLTMVFQLGRGRLAHGWGG